MTIEFPGSEGVVAGQSDGSVDAVGTRHPTVTVGETSRTGHGPPTAPAGRPTLRNPKRLRSGGYRVG